MSRNDCYNYYRGVLDRIKIIVYGLRAYKLENENKEDISTLKGVLLKCFIIQENALWHLGQTSDNSIYIDLKYLMPCAVKLLSVEDLFKLLCN